MFENANGLCHHYGEHVDRGAALPALGIRPATVARRPAVEVIVPNSAMLAT